jgi:hypothetical protein
VISRRILLIAGGVAGLAASLGAAPLADAARRAPAVSPEDDPAFYREDPSHPIPSMTNLDVVGKRRGGGADLIIVIATPLAADERSQLRLLKKVALYLGFVASDDYRKEFGAPDAASAHIVVSINEKSDPAIFDLLERCKLWTLANNATLVVERTPSQ